ncbi:hypothetical protein V500_01817 [Pseudogymnoascus sp. VKM F-4518 (FW-2643)]|nr:hypothetical protein V500_01817 [Pseudogymnoascus sp. VKM F-4518 (FW-2643)]
MHGLAIPVATQLGDNHVIFGADLPANPQHFASPPNQFTKIPKMDDKGSLSCWIEALGVDDACRPPRNDAMKAVACFYVLYCDATPGAKKPFYRAVYLTQRTLNDLLAGIGSKLGFNFLHYPPITAHPHQRRRG